MPDVAVQPAPCIAASPVVIGSEVAAESRYVRGRAVGVVEGGPVDLVEALKHGWCLLGGVPRVAGWRRRPGGRGRAPALRRRAIMSRRFRAFLDTGCCVA